MPKIIDDAADELTSYITTKSDNNKLWELGIEFVLYYMSFSILKGVE